MEKARAAMRGINRADFVPEHLRAHSAMDAALPIGFEQTISQPSTVKQMLEWLEPELDQKILDVGSGSGWTSALLAKLVGPGGQVYAVERLPELIEFGRRNCQRAGIPNVNFFRAGEHYGLAEHAPYDRILVSASAQALPEDLLAQLKDGGKLVAPVQNNVLEVTKKSSHRFVTAVHPGYAFVPLV